MKLDCVTVTGADYSVQPSELLLLSKEFPFVEWGILVSETRGGGRRFPSRAWLLDLLVVSMTARIMSLSLHVCGRLVRKLLFGDDDSFDGWPTAIRLFQRVQLNFHGLPHEFDVPAAAVLLRRIWPESQTILQMDGTHNEDLLGFLIKHGLDAVPLFDTSGGAGIVPRAWPAPIPGIQYHGYAGGLGPENVEAELERIAVAAGNARVWIDMESRVRSADDARLDLDKVRRVLEFCAPHVGWRAT